MLENWGPYSLVIGVLLLCFWALRPKKGFKPPETKAFDANIFKHFKKRGSLFVNKSELALFSILNARLGADYLVFSKVRLEDIIGVNHAGLSPKFVWSLRGRVKSRHVDFLITSRRGVPLMIIELDGSSHASKAAQRPDALKDGLAAAVNLPLRRVRARQDFHKFTARIQKELSAY